MNNFSSKPNPKLYWDALLSNEAKTQSQNLHQSGIKSSHIQKYLLKNVFNAIITLQIQTIIEILKNSIFNSKTTDLSLYVQQSIGLDYILEILSEKENSKAAILTIHRNEIENLSMYRKPIFIDGAYVLLGLKWGNISYHCIWLNINLYCWGIMYSTTQMNRLWIDCCMHWMNMMKQL